jgi:DNA-binding transcriptional LysR family regulator
MLTRDLNDLSLFAAVVEAGGFSAAARAVGVPKSRLSRHVAALEERLGLRLVERSTRRFAVTAVGQEIYRHAQSMVAAADAVDDIALDRKAEPEGLVRVACPLGAEAVLARTLPALLARHPRLRVQLIVTNRRIDLIEEGVDVAVRFRESLDTDADLTVRVLGRARSLLVAAPRLFADRPAPTEPRDLAGFPTITHGERRGPETWRLSGPGGTTYVHTHQPRLSGHDFTMLTEAVVSGLGIGMLPQVYCRGPLAAGTLIEILPGWSGSEGIAHVVFTGRRGLLPGVRVVIDTVVDTLRDAYSDATTGPIPARSIAATGHARPA